MSPLRIASTARREVSLLREDTPLFSRALAERPVGAP